MCWFFFQHFKNQCLNNLHYKVFYQQHLMVFPSCLNILITIRFLYCMDSVNLDWFSKYISLADWQILIFWEKEKLLIPLELELHIFIIIVVYQFYKATGTINKSLKTNISFKILQFPFFFLPSNMLLNSLKLWSMYHITNHILKKTFDRMTK